MKAIARAGLGLLLLGCSGGEGDPARPDGGGGAADARTDRPDAGCVGAGCVEPGECPPGMVWIDANTCVDATEATVGDFLGFVNGLGEACDDPGPTCQACAGQRCFTSNASNPWHHDPDGWYIEGPVGMSLDHPARYVAFAAARSACAAAGKRLCNAADWDDACGGPTGRAFPYGERYQPGRCNSASGLVGQPWEVGHEALCASADHAALLDMSGNVWEWVDDCAGGECQVRGGSFKVDGDFFENALSCAGSQGWDTTDEVFGTEFDLGYRCCANPL